MCQHRMWHVIAMTIRRVTIQPHMLLLWLHQLFHRLCFRFCGRVLFFSDVGLRRLLLCTTALLRAIPSFVPFFAASVAFTRKCKTCGCLRRLGFLRLGRTITLVMILATLETLNVRRNLRTTLFRVLLGLFGRDLFCHVRARFAVTVEISRFRIQRYRLFNLLEGIARCIS